MIAALVLSAMVGACPSDDAVCWRNRVLELRGEKANVEKALDLERSSREAAQRLAANEKERAEDWKRTAETAAERTWVERNPQLVFVGGVVVGVVGTAATVYLLTR